MSTLAEFAEDLARRSDAQLARLLVRRPDAMSPPVANLADLATRLTSAHSISLALESLNLPALQTLARWPFPPGHECLPTLHELALVIAAPSSADDADPRRCMPVTAVTLALGEAFALESGAFESQPPAPQLMSVSRVLRDNAAGSAIESLLRHVNVLMEHVYISPIDSLRGGRIGVRTVRKLSKDLGVEESGLSFYLELAAEARLIHFHPAEQQWWAADHSWPHRDRAEQWLRLVGAWLHCTHCPGGNPLDGMRAIAPVHIRSVALSAVLALAGKDHVAPAPESVVDLLRWRHPLHIDFLAQHVPEILHEMEILGITGAGSPSAPGRALVAELDGAASATRPGVTVGTLATSAPATTTALAALLPAPIKHFVVQGDLTAVAPGFLSPEVSSSLRRMAEPEGHGAAGIFRFSQNSLEAAMTSGMRAHSIREFLNTHSSTTVPQSLDYLITAAAIRIEATGPLLPQAPRPEARKRHKPGPGVVHSRPAGPTEAEIAAQITRLRSQPTWGARDTGESGPALVMEELRQAVRTGSAIWLRAVTGQGEVERVLVRPVSLAAGMLRARTVLGDRERRFSIHRIMATETTEQDQEGAPHG
ncbi:Helicase conserved C-terminal domain-containing protein [Arthrobacter alpinus]|uniref:Helicase conserved C-terminal domain-containing protein n=1 Tax=Arthrobacter alpinus TaxID=656366 RepID=A0A1H5LAP3_9MICC|nr:helicase-associated domain-containing protein [Arthrobacter alpinus]SEE73288.1 Helicase conserved C-terminal domain-containing protein [Arthrobacter alpinus]